MITAERVYEVFGITPGNWKIVNGKSQYYPDKERVETVRSDDYNSDMMACYKGNIIADFTKAHGERAHAFEEAKNNACLLKASPEMLVTFVNTVIELDDRSYYINSYNLLVKAIESADNRGRKWPELLKELKR